MTKEGFRPPEPDALATETVPQAADGAWAGGADEIRAGHLGVRLARNEAELEWLQRLRYRVFFEEMGAHPTPEVLRLGRDLDEYDPVADHLLVLDHSLGDGPKAVVGTYRLIRRPAAAAIGRFYSEAEYDISPILAWPGEVLELGRSCVDAGHRTRGTLQLLWKGIAAYVFRHRIDLMFGCASLPGTDLDALAPMLTHLWHAHLAPPALRPRAIASRHVEMRRLDPGTIDVRGVVNTLPPLIKGYLRLGGFIGDGAVIDEAFNTTDVCVVVKTDLVTDKYYRHYERRLRDAFDDPPRAPAE